MNAYLLFACELAISLCASLVVLRVLSRPLFNVLGLVCPEERAATFWLCYTRLMLVFTPLILVLLVDFVTRFSDPMTTLRLAAISVLGGLLLGLYAVGRSLRRFVLVPSIPSVNIVNASGSTNVGEAS